MKVLCVVIAGFVAFCHEWITADAFLSPVASQIQIMLQPDHHSLASSSSSRMLVLPKLAEIDYSAAPSLEFLGELQTLPTLSVGQALSGLSSVSYETAEAWAGPFFGFSLFPYIAFLYLLGVEENKIPKGVFVGFAVLLVFVFLTIPAAIAAKLWFGASLADCDWLHASAESLLTGTNLVTVVAFRQALAAAKEAQEQSEDLDSRLPLSATSYAPMAWLMAGWTLMASATALVPVAFGDPSVHDPFLGGFLDLPDSLTSSLEGRPEPVNALSVGCWIIHISSLVEFLAIMEYCWRWGDLTRNPKWKGLVWGLLPLHTSGVTACTYHFLYNQLPILIPLQAFLTCVGNITAAYAAWRIARSNSWEPEFLRLNEEARENAEFPIRGLNPKDGAFISEFKPRDRGDMRLSMDSNYSYIAKLFLGCGVASYAIKYGETWLSVSYDANLVAALSFIGAASSLNALKWYQRSRDPSYNDGWL